MSRAIFKQKIIACDALFHLKIVSLKKNLDQQSCHLIILRLLKDYTFRKETNAIF